MPVLHPANKIRYREGDRVEIALSGDTANIVMGTIVGFAADHIIEWWIVKLDRLLSTWEFSCISVQHTFIRPSGDNRPFLCEGVSRILS